MKTINSILSIILVANVASAGGLTNKEKQEFATFYRAWSKVLEEFPDKPEVRILFFDVNSDGNEEAIATSRGQFYEDGNIWSIFELKNRAWVPFKLKMATETMVDPSSGLFARGDEFYSLSTAGNAPILTVVHQRYDKLIEGGMDQPLSSKVYIDKDGFVKTEKLPSLDQLVAYSPDFQKLERLKVETFKK